MDIALLVRLPLRSDYHNTVMLVSLMGPRGHLNDLAGSTEPHFSHHHANPRRDRKEVVLNWSTCVSKAQQCWE